ncbi:hypothetical protein [Mesorhizobium marinum]|uniref:hypothetical protein n=1 Tax=Mesorhizobium marinum TaxID=3228790 RepID=UPI00346712A4
MPPNLAVWSEKRIAVGGITEDEILHEVRTHPDSPVMLRRRGYSPDLLNRIGALTPRLSTATEGYSTPSIPLFAATAPETPLESRLLAHLHMVVAGSLGGLDGQQPGERLARPDPPVTFA